MTTTEPQFDFLHTFEDVLVPPQTSSLDEEFKAQAARDVLTALYNLFEDETVPLQLSDLDEDFSQRFLATTKLSSQRSDINLSFTGLVKAMDRLNVPRTDSCDSLSSYKSNQKLDQFGNSVFSNANINRAIEAVKMFTTIFEDFMHNVAPENVFEASEEEQQSFPRFC